MWGLCREPVHFWQEGLLNCGGALDAATSYFLPLDSVTRALDHFVRMMESREEEEEEEFPQQQKRPDGLPSRQTLECNFDYKSVDEVEGRLASLSPKEVEWVRRQTRRRGEFNGLLTVEEVIKGGIADRAGVQQGDVVWRVNGEFLNTYDELERLVDATGEDGSDTKVIRLEVKRGASSVEFTDLTPRSLWDLIPRSFVEYAGGIYHPASLQFSLRVGGLIAPGAVVVADRGFANSRQEGFERNCVITAVNERATPSLAEFVEVICTVPRGAKYAVRYVDVDTNPNVEITCTVIGDRGGYFPLRRCTRRDARRRRGGEIEGEKWIYEDLKYESYAVRDTSDREIHPVEKTEEKEGEEQEEEKDGEESRYRSLYKSSFVTVHFDAPFSVDGNPSLNFFGLGLVVGKNADLILVDRNTVTGPLGDARVIFNDRASTEAHARVVFVHPFLNFALLRPDFLPPGLLKSVPLAETLLGPTPPAPLRRGDALTMVGISYQANFMVSHNHVISAVERTSIRTPTVPRFIAKNFDHLVLEPPPLHYLGGMLLDGEGRPRAILASFSYADNEGKNREHSYAVSLHPAARALALFEEENERRKTARAQPLPSAPLVCHSLGLDLGLVSASQAVSEWGLSPEWTERFAREAAGVESGLLRTPSDVIATGGANQLFKVVSLPVDDSATAGNIQLGDLLLTVGGKLASDYERLDEAVVGGARPNIVVLRDGAVVEVDAVPPVVRDTLGTTRILVGAGMQLQGDFPGARAHGYSPAGGKWVYLSRYEFGSGAQRAKLVAPCFVESIGDCETKDLDAARDALARLRSGEFARVCASTLKGMRFVSSFRVDWEFFPLRDYRYDASEGTWRIEEIEVEKTVSPVVM